MKITVLFALLVLFVCFMLPTEQAPMKMPKLFGKFGGLKSKISRFIPKKSAIPKKATIPRQDVPKKATINRQYVPSMSWLNFGRNRQELSAFRKQKTLPSFPKMTRPSVNKRPMMTRPSVPKRPTMISPFIAKTTGSKQKKPVAPKYIPDPFPSKPVLFNNTMSSLMTTSKPTTDEELWRSMENIFEEAKQMQNASLSELMAWGRKTGNER